MKIAVDIDARVEAKWTNQEKHLSREKTNKNIQFVQKVHTTKEISLLIKIRVDYL